MRNVWNVYLNINFKIEMAYSKYLLLYIKQYLI